MKVIIGQDVLAMFPNLRIGVVHSRGIDNTSTSQAVAARMHAAMMHAREHLTMETLTAHPYIQAWRTTYQRFGSKPNSYRPTAEATLRRVLKGESIAPISTVVDLYLAVEVEHYLPIGGYDLAHVVGAITLRTSPGDEPFTPLGATEATEKTYPGEVVYADDEKILTRRWNYRDCDTAKITAASTNIALFCEATTPAIPDEALEACIRQLADLLQEYCQGSNESHFLTAQTQQTWEF